MISNQPKDAKDLLPEWVFIPIPFGDLTKPTFVAQVCMDNHLIILLHEDLSKAPYGSFNSLVAFDLRDHSVQKIKLDHKVSHRGKMQTFIRYKDNQIIKFGGYSMGSVGYSPLERFTIESFQPFSVKCERMDVNGQLPSSIYHTAQIYNDSMYVLNGKTHDYFMARKNPGNDSNPDQDQWCLDLNTLTWTVCKSSGDKPESRNGRNSFIVEDNLYVYGNVKQKPEETLTKDIYVLNLNSMNWTKIEQEEGYITNRGVHMSCNGDQGLLNAFSKVHDHLIILEDLQADKNSPNDRLCCWNRKTNSWSTFDIQRQHNEFNSDKDSWIVSNNLLLSPWFYHKTHGIFILNLDHVGLPVSESPEQKRLKSLFMNEEESDVKFKVQDKVIPAHKQILIEKSKYFANLFNSGMVESKQDIIEISDCDYPIFQEYLRFLYCDKIQFDDEKLAFKLLTLADKYVQNNLSTKCINYLMSNVSIKNVYTILGLARQEDISQLSNCCLTFLKEKTTVQNVAGTIEYLNKQDNPEFAQENLELNKKIVNFVMEHFQEIFKEQEDNLAQYEDFLIKNISIDTVLSLVNLVFDQNNQRNYGYPSIDSQSTKPASVETVSSQQSQVSGGLPSVQQSKPAGGLFGSKKPDSDQSSSPEQKKPFGGLMSQSVSGGTAPSEGLKKPASGGLFGSVFGQFGSGGTAPSEGSNRPVSGGLFGSIFGQSGSGGTAPSEGSKKPPSGGLFDSIFNSGSGKPGISPAGGMFSGLGSGFQKPINTEKEKFEKATSNLKPALYKFIQNNATTLKEKDITKELPKGFLLDLLGDFRTAQGESLKDQPADQHSSEIIIPGKNVQGHPPEWNTLSLLKYRGLLFAQVLMGHHLILIYQEAINSIEKPALMAFNLRDHSQQVVMLTEFPMGPLEGSTFTRYKDNQIIKFGSQKKELRNLVRITIESFTPLQVNYEEIKVEGEPTISGHTAQIYNDCLYIFGGTYNPFFLIFFDLSNKHGPLDIYFFSIDELTWKKYGNGEWFGPNKSSCLLQDNIYLYGGNKNISVIHLSNNEEYSSLKFSLDSQTWSKLEQEETYLANRLAGFRKKGLESALYKNHLIILGDGQTDKNSEKEVLCFLNLHTYSWSTFDIQKNKLHPDTRDLTVYNNLLIASGIAPDCHLAISFLNLDHINGLSIPEPPQKSLFMSEEDSDVKFKVQDKIIPAHKQILIEKSKYFANLFNSGMAEDIIEISDCDYPVFQEYLRFLYSDDVQLDEKLAFKLFTLADKYVQDDLSAKCTDFLKYNLTSENVYTILDVSRQENILHLRNWCFNFIKEKIDIKNVHGLVEYLAKQNNPELAKENIELRDKAICVIHANYQEIPQDQKNFYENFLIKNITFDTIFPLINFISGHNYKREKPKLIAKPKEINAFPPPSWNTTVNKEESESEKKKLEPEIPNLIAAFDRFILINLPTLEMRRDVEKLHQAYLIDLVQRLPKTQDKKENP